MATRVADSELIRRVVGLRNGVRLYRKLAKRTGHPELVEWFNQRADKWERQADELVKELEPCRTS